MATLNELMNADVRDVKARITITFLDPVYQQTATITSSDTSSLSSADQLINGVHYPSQHWISLNDNKLDGFYRFLPSPFDPEEEVGWWSADASEADGTFLTPPSFTLTFATLDVKAFTLIGDNLSNTYPVDFTIEYFDDLGGLIATDTITNNEKVVYSQMNNHANVDEIKVTIQKINKPNTKARILEASLLLIAIFDESNIISLSTLEEINYEQAGVPIGGISANEVTAELLNVDDVYNINNPDSPVVGLLTRNRKIEVEFGIYNTDTFGIDWYNFGTYYSVDWNLSPETISFDVTGRDRLENLRNTEYKNGQVFVGQTLYWLFEEILTDAGLGVTQYNINTNLQSYILPYAWFGTMSHRQALSELAESNLVNVYVDREGIVQVGKVEPTATSQFQYNNDNVFKKDYPSRLDDSVNKLEVKSYKYELSAQQVVGEFDDLLTIPAGGTFKLTIDFDTNRTTDIQPPTYVKDANIQVNEVLNFCWGSQITFENIGATEETVTSVIIEGKILEEKNSMIVISEDTDAQVAAGMVKAVHDNKFVQGINYAQTLADDLFDIIKLANLDIVLDNRGHIGLKLGDKITFYDSDYAVSKEYMIVRKTLDWTGDLSGETKGKLV